MDAIHKHKLKVPFFDDPLVPNINGPRDPHINIKYTSNHDSVCPVSMDTMYSIFIIH